MCQWCSQKVKKDHHFLSVKQIPKEIRTGGGKEKHLESSHYLGMEELHKFYGTGLNKHLNI